MKAEKKGPGLKVFSQVENKKAFKEATELHKVLLKFNAKFRPGPGHEREWKLLGYELMRAVDRWAKRYPDFVTVTSCDDDVFSSSCLVLIDSKRPGKFMGTTVILISQHKPPSEFFLYTEHAHALRKALSRKRIPFRNLGKKVGWTARSTT